MSKFLWFYLSFLDGFGAHQLVSEPPNRECITFQCWKRICLTLEGQLVEPQTSSDHQSEKLAQQVDHLILELDSGSRCSHTHHHPLLRKLSPVENLFCLLPMMVHAQTLRHGMIHIWVVNRLIFHSSPRASRQTGPLYVLWNTRNTN